MEDFPGDILLVAFNFTASGYAFCNRQILSISQNTALFSLLGTTYGGNRQTTFCLPNLQGRSPIHQGTSAFGNYTIGQIGGSPTTTLTTTQLPLHSHLFNVVAAAGDTAVPNSTSYLAKNLSTGSGPNTSTENIYSSGTAGATLNPSAIANTGSGSPVPISSPYLTLNYIIALQDIFPSRN